MSRNFPLLFLVATHVAMAASQRGRLDPAFEKVPFEQWLGEHDSARFHWRASVSHAQLSFHHRLQAQIEISLDGKDLQGRRDHDRLVFLIQITDRDGVRFQEHSSIEFDKLDPNIKNAMVESSQRAFFLPGDYRLAAAVFDTTTGEHSTTQAAFRVGAPRDEFLLQAWRDLPMVEFARDLQSPDSWYLPDVEGRLEWEASPHAPRLNIILNVAPSVAAPGSRTPPSAGMDALLPTLKALPGSASSVSEQVELLDLARRRDVFHQDNVQDLDWSRLKPALGDANTASIDVHSLSDRHHDAQFFVSEIRKVLRASEQPSVLVVLTTAVEFGAGEDLGPISLESLPKVRVIYVRYHAPPERPNPLEEQPEGRGLRMGGYRMGAPMPPARVPEVVDQLAATLKPLNPEIVDVSTPAQMTRVFSEIERILSK